MGLLKDSFDIGHVYSVDYKVMVFAYVLRVEALVEFTYPRFQFSLPYGAPQILNI